jgi:hypothetical protein
MTYLYMRYRGHNLDNIKEDGMEVIRNIHYTILRFCEK